MIGALEVAVLVATAALAVFGLVRAAMNRPPDRPLRLALGSVVALLVVQAGIAAFRVLTGTQLPETTTFLIYLVVSVCVLPIAGQFAFAEPSRWGGAVVAVGAIATFVAVLRLQGLWQAGGA